MSFVDIASPFVFPPALTEFTKLIAHGGFSYVESFC
jgi:hypothetical protein